MKRLASGIDVRIGVVDPVHAALGDQQRIGIEFQRALDAGVVGGDVGLPDAPRQQDDQPMPQVPVRAQPDERLGHALHLDGGHHPHVDSLRAVSTPRSISAFMTVPSIPMLSASARPMPQPSAIRPRK